MPLERPGRLSDGLADTGSLIARLMEGRFIFTAPPEFDESSLFRPSFFHFSTSFLELVSRPGKLSPG